MKFKFLLAFILRNQVALVIRCMNIGKYTYLDLTVSWVLGTRGLIRQVFPHPLHPQAQSLLLLPGVWPGCMCRFHFHHCEELTHAQTLVSKHRVHQDFCGGQCQALSDLLRFPLHHLVHPRLPLQLLTLSTCSSENASGTQVDCPWASGDTFPPK